MIVGSLKRRDIVLTMDLHPVTVSAAKASPLALIVNELLGDAVRRGLSDGGGEIHLEIRRLNGHFLIRVVDTVTPVDVDREQEAFSQAMLDASLLQLRAKLERKVEGHRTDVRQAHARALLHRPSAFVNIRARLAPILESLSHRITFGMVLAYKDSDVILARLNRGPDMLRPDKLASRCVERQQLTVFRVREDLDSNIRIVSHHFNPKRILGKVIIGHV